MCGLDYYGAKLIPEWNNSLLLCTLKGSRIVQLKLSDDHKTITGTKEYLQDSYGRLRYICVSPAGRVFISTSNGNNDKIVEIMK